MPWDQRGIVEQRWLMLQRFFRERAPVSKVSREFGVSRKTFYKFKHCFEAEGFKGLEDKSRAPLKRPKRISEAGEKGVKEGVQICRELLKEAKSLVSGVYLIPSFGRFEQVLEVIE